MRTSLLVSRDEYLEFFLQFLWKEWTALGVAGHGPVELRHVVDPEALLLFTCSLARYDSRLFDEVLDWLVENGRFLNIQRMRNILRRESFAGGVVLSAIADRLAGTGLSAKWSLLARTSHDPIERQSLFLLTDGRPLPEARQKDEVFLRHGLSRAPIVLRNRARQFSFSATACTLLRLRALLGVNSRSEVLTYLVLNGGGHPREVARELYYSQKAIHEVMTDMACSGVVYSSRTARERIFRVTADTMPLLVGNTPLPVWWNWPVLLSAAEAVWRLHEEFHHPNIPPLAAESEIVLRLTPLLEKMSRSRKIPSLPALQARQGHTLLQAFRAVLQAAAA